MMRSPVRWTTLGAGLLVVVLVVGAGVLITQRDDTANVGQEAPSERLNDLDIRMSGSLAWVGDTLFSYGGAIDGAFNRGELAFSNSAALIDPVTGEAEVLPEPPFDGALNRGGAAVAVDDEIVLAGGVCTATDGYGDEPCPPNTLAAATYDRVSGSWSSVELPNQLRDTSAGVDALGATGDGRSVFRIESDTQASYWTYAPSSGTWTAVPAPPVDQGAACLAGDQIVVASASFRHGGEILPDDPSGSDDAGVVVYAEDDGWVDPRIQVLDLNAGEQRWAESPVAEDFFIESDMGTLRITCSDDVVLLHNSGRDVRQHPGAADLVDEPWQRVSAGPTEAIFPGVLPVGDEFVFLSPAIDAPPGDVPAQIYNPVTGSWRTQPGLPRAAGGLVPAEDAIVGISSWGPDGEGPAAVVYAPVTDR